MKAAGLLLVFVTAKLPALSGYQAPWSGWTFVSYFWQDVVAALLFGLADTLLRATGVHARVRWTAYWAVVVYAILNIPVERALFTPLTWPMLRAARGPLLDSLLIYLTWTNGAYAALALIAATLPLLWRGPRTRAWRGALIATTVAMIAVGPVAASRVDTSGLDRNVLGALAWSALPHVAARDSTNDWRASPFGADRRETLSHFRGIAGRRNVVLISLESTGAQYLGIYGASRDPAPNLTRLASRALVFDNAYAVYPESIKGLFSILCSMFPAFDIAPEMYERVSCPALPAALAAAGYSTALFHSGRFAYLGMESIIRNRGYQLLADAGDIGGNRNSSFGVDEPATVARMLSWIDRRPHDAPFFLTYLPIAGHHPYESPAGGPFSNSNDLGRYLNAVHEGDAALGTLIEGVRTRGLENDTLWIILGDHGEAFGQHQGNFGHTFHLYDENVHVPFLVAAPGALTGQIRVKRTVSLLDTAPTILDLVGLHLPAEYQGRSMLEDGQRMALFFTDYSLGLVGLRDGPLKYIYELGSARSKMFDLAQDPQERRDIALTQPERARWYRRDLEEWAAAQKGRVTVRLKPDTM